MSHTPIFPASKKNFSELHTFRYDNPSESDILKAFEQNYQTQKEQLPHIVVSLEQYAVSFFQNIHSNEIQKYAFTPYHSHNYVEMNYIYSGTCYEYIDKQLIKLTKGDLLILSPQMCHSVYLSPYSLGRNICIRKNLAEQLARELSATVSKHFLKDILSSTSYYVFHTKEDTLLPSLFLELDKYAYKCLTAGTTNYQRAEKLLSLIMSELHYKSSEAKLPYYSNSSALRGENTEYTEITKYIQNNLKTISRKKVENYFGLSSMTLYRLFRANGTTFQQYVKTLRERQAIYFLKHSSLTVGEIAEVLGFESPEYFCRFFKKVRSMSPTKFRKVFRENGSVDLQSNI